ncbi:MAG TPA: hypothetical protein PLD59_02285 [Tepidisphaeraceae bacterium]|nr:hypothetical protein [Tepidisphaeraceae bacterium]
MGAAPLQSRFEQILARSDRFGDGGKIVLETAYHTLAAGQAINRWPEVGLEDLWTHAIKEGGILFSKPDARWAKTGPQETKDMIGQTTIGPWQITVGNVKNRYGQPYGVGPDSPDADVFAYCKDRPTMQAGMISDYIQEAYAQYGARSPYAIQKYFWLEAFVKKEIGQAAWDKSVLPTPPDGDWRNLTAAMKADTGFYAKQIVCGTKENPYGLLYWLWVTRDEAGILSLLKVWQSQPIRAWDRDMALATNQATTQFCLLQSDLLYFPDQAGAEHITKLMNQIAK